VEEELERLQMELMDKLMQPVVLVQDRVARVERQLAYSTEVVEVVEQQEELADHLLQMQ
jgi:hypothetical protein